MPWALALSDYVHTDREITRTDRHVDQELVWHLGRKLVVCLASNVPDGRGTLLKRECGAMIVLVGSW